MDGDIGLHNVRRVSLIVHISMVCIILLVSCVPSNPFIQGSPEPTTTNGGSTSQPIASPVPDQSVPPVPISLQPSVTASPHITPDVNASTQTATFTVPAKYTLDAVLDFNQHTLTVSEMISYMNYTPEALVDLILVVEPNRWEGGFTLVSLTWEEGAIIDNYDLKSDQMHIPLPKPLPVGDALGIKLTYQLTLPEIPEPSGSNRPIPYGYTKRQTNLVDWYPYIPAYRTGVGWLVHQHWWFGEHQVFDVADYQVKVALTEPVKDLVIAASAPAEQDGDSYIYHLETARSFALSASSEYLMQSTHVGDVMIYSYSFPFDKYAGQEVLHNTADALQLYSQLIMPYPHSSLSVVEADFLDGMEYDGLYFLSYGFYDLYDGTPKGYLTFIAAHETAHQWWYGLVGNDQALEPWLDEAMCTYMEHIFYENIYADYPPGSGKSLVDWWWYYRVNFYNPVGWVDGTIYDFNQFTSYRDAVYLNGAKFLDDLRSLMGDVAFFAFLRDYASQNVHRVATASDFFAILKEHTSKDLSGLLTEYFQSNK